MSPRSRLLAAVAFVAALSGCAGTTSDAAAPERAAFPDPGVIHVHGLGVVTQLADGGRTWARRGSAGGQPEALAVQASGSAPTVFVAVADRGILASTDGGQTFTTRYAE